MIDLPETKRLYQGQMLAEPEIAEKRRYGRERGKAIRRGTWSGHRAPLATRSPNETETAWAAGFFQGEGHIRADGRLASACQVEREPLAALQEMYGGSLTYCEPPSRRPAASPFWKWTVCGDNARAFIGSVYPWLTGAKRDRALLVLEGS